MSANLVDKLAKDPWQGDCARRSGGGSAARFLWCEDLEVARWTNWARTVSADVAPVRPESVEELQHLVAEAAARGERVKAIGAGHSFTAIGETDGVQILPDRLSGILHADSSTGLVTVLAGTRLHELNDALWHVGLALPNLGDIDVQTIAGAISTGTHGTGRLLGGLATQVHAMQLVAADGSVLYLDADSDLLFAAARVGLGALGIIATVTLQCVPAFALHASELPGSLDRTLDELDDRDRTERPLRVLLVPAHPAGARQAQQPHPARRSAAPARPAAPRRRRRVPVQRRVRRDQPGHDAPPGAHPPRECRSPPGR